MEHHYQHIDPIPQENASGGLDFKVDWCEGICYSSEGKESVCVIECPHCAIILEEGLVCKK